MRLLHTELIVEVKTIWNNNSGNGSENDDFYWHMLLIVPLLATNQLFARSRTSLQWEQGAFYNLRGEDFLKSISRGQRSHVLITSTTKSMGETAYGRPTSSNLAQVQMVDCNRVLATRWPRMTTSK